MKDWQTYAALGIVFFAVLVAGRTLVWPFVRAFRKQGVGGGCGGGCSKPGCAKKV